MLTDEQLLAWWRLRRLPGIGNIAVNRIRLQLDDPAQLFCSTVEQLIDFGLTPHAAKNWQQQDSLSHGFEVLQHWRQQPDCDVLLAGVSPYPDNLSALPDAPILLYARGNLAALEQPCIAMVGSRNPSHYGVEWAKQCAGRLASVGLTVVSGLALGIDGASHQGAIEQGRSIAVLGCGADIIYPRRHLKLAQHVLHQGLIVSEFEPGTAPKPQQFPSRNRIISGLSLGTVVVEATLKSGSLITAGLAAEQGRDVMALPGVVNNPLSHGCHQLIRDGATLVRDADDILQQLNIFDLRPHTSTPLSQSTNSQPSLLACIDFAPTSVDVIAVRSQLPVAELLPQLLNLELAGWLTQSAGGFVRIR